MRKWLALLLTTLSQDTCNNKGARQTLAPYVKIVIPTTKGNKCVIE